MGLFDSDIARLTEQRLLSLRQQSVPAATDRITEKKFFPTDAVTDEEGHSPAWELHDAERRISDVLEKESRRYPHPLTLSR